MISAGAGAFPQTTTLLSPLGGATQINSGGIESAFSAGLQAGGQIYSKRLLEQLDKEPVLRPRSGGRDVLPLHHANGRFGQSHGGTFRIARTLQQPQTAMKFLHSILLLSLVAGCATKKEVRSVQRVEVPGTTLAAADMPEIRTPETVKAYPVGRYTDPNFPDEMHERHTLYRREQAADWNYRPSRPYALPLWAVSRPSPIHRPPTYAKTDAEQINAQQKAYAEALLEQNVALKRAN